MSISEAMVGQELLEYLREHNKEFEQFMLSRLRIDEGDVRCFGDISKRCLILTIGVLAYGRTKQEINFAIKVEKLGANSLGSLEGN
jgi:hypothetical protein